MRYDGTGRGHSWSASRLLVLCCACGPHRGPAGASESDTSAAAEGASASGASTSDAPAADLGGAKRAVALEWVATIRGTVPGQRLGVQVEFGGDHDGDGIEDLLVGQAGGQAYVFFGGAFATDAVQPPDQPLQAGKTLRLPGYVNYASAGDFDGDGLPDVVLVAARTGQWDLNRLYVVHSDPGDSLVEVVEGSDKIALISESTTSFELGTPKSDGYPQTLSFADIDGDGRDDLIARRPFEMFIVDGVSRGAAPSSIDEAGEGIGGKLIGTGDGGSVLGLPRLPGDAFGHVVADGFWLSVVPDDLPSGTNCHDGGPCRPEFADVGWPPYPIAYSASAEPSQRRLAIGSSTLDPSDHVRLLPRLDGLGEGDDGTAHLAGGQPDWYRPDPGRPEPFVLGFSIAFVGDLNADGIPDLAMSSRHPTTAIVALSAPDGGSTDLSEALRTGDAAQVYGVEGDDFGWQLAAGRDVTGDGTPDLVVGAPSDADGSAPGGAVYIYSITYE